MASLELPDHPRRAVRVERPKTGLSLAGLAAIPVTIAATALLLGVAVASTLAYAADRLLNAVLRRGRR